MSTAHATAAPGPHLRAVTGTGRPIKPRTRTASEQIAGRPPGNKGRKYPPEILEVEEIQTLLAQVRKVHPKDDIRRRLARERLHALCVVLWRTGIRISEALDLINSDLHPEDGSIVIRCGKGGKRRIVMMDEWGWRELQPWLETRETIKPGYLFPIVSGPTEGLRWAPTDVRRKFREAQAETGMRKRFHPHGLRHNFSVEFWRETGNLLALMTQLGHVNLAVTQLYVRTLGVDELLAPVRERPAPVVPLGFTERGASRSIGRAA